MNAKFLSDGKITSKITDDFDTIDIYTTYKPDGGFSSEQPKKKKKQQDSSSNASNVSNVSNASNASNASDHSESSSSDLTENDHKDDRYKIVDKFEVVDFYLNTRTGNFENDELNFKTKCKKWCCVFCCIPNKEDILDNDDD